MPLPPSPSSSRTRGMSLSPPSRRAMSIEQTVTVGSAPSPVSLWVSPWPQPRWLIDLEKDLSLRLSTDLRAVGYRRRSSCPDALRAQVESGEVVAVDVGGLDPKGAGLFLESHLRVERGRNWKRGRLQGEVHSCAEGPVADFFLVDTGRVVRNVDLAGYVKTIPATFMGREGQAVNVVLKDLVPVARSLQVEHMRSRDKFVPMVQQDWSSSAVFLVNAVLSAAMSDVGTKGGSEIRAVFDEGQRPSTKMSGNIVFTLSASAAASVAIKKHNIKLMPPGEKNDLRQLLLGTEHAVAGRTDRSRFDKYQLPDLPLLKMPSRAPRPKNVWLSAYENVCGNGEVLDKSGPSASGDFNNNKEDLIRARKAVASEMEAEYHEMKLKLQRSHRVSLLRANDDSFGMGDPDPGFDVSQEVEQETDQSEHGKLWDSLRRQSPKKNKKRQHKNRA